MPAGATKCGKQKDGAKPSGGDKLAFGTRFLYEGRLVVLDRERKMTSIFTARPFGVSA